MRYDVFVSYRHHPIDVKWARWLVRRLGGLRAPRKMLREGLSKARVGAVFRDNEEMAASPDLERALHAALSESRFLVVVCSPRAKASAWIDREIRQFRALGGADRILPLLVEGTPETSFPNALWEPTTDAGMSTREPRAASPAPEPGESLRAARRRALLALAAPVLGCDVEQLRRRDQEAAARRRLTWAAGTSVVCCALGLLSVVALSASRSAARSAADARRGWMDALREQARLEQARGRPDRALALAGEAIELGDRSEGCRVLLRELMDASRDCEGRMPGETARSVVTGVALLSSPGVAVVSALGGPVLTWRVGEASPSVLRAAPARGASELAASADGNVVFDPTSGRVWAVSSAGLESRWRPSSEGDSAQFGRLSPDGSMLATYGEEADAVRLTQTLPPFESRRVAVPESGVLILEFSPSGALLAIGGQDLRDPSRKGFLRVYSWRRDRVEAIGLPEDASAVSGVAFDERALQLLISTADGTAYLWPGAVQGARRAIPLVGHDDGVTAVAFLSERRQAVTAGNDGTLRTWTVPDGAPIRVIGRTDGPVSCMVVSRDETMVASTGRDRSICVHRPSDWRPVAEYRGHSVEVRCLAFAPDSRRLISSGGPETRVWRLPSDRARPGFASGDERTSSCRLASNGSFAVSVVAGERCRLSRLGDGADDLWLPANGIRDVRAVEATQDRSRAAVGDGQNGVTLWDTTSGRVVATVVDEGRGRRNGLLVDSIEFSPSSQSLLAGFPDGSVVVVDGHDGTERFRSMVPGWVNSVTWGPDDRWIAVAYGRRVGLLDPTGKRAAEDVDVGSEVSRVIGTHGVGEWAVGVLADNRAVVIDVGRRVVSSVIHVDGGTVLDARCAADGCGAVIVTRAGSVARFALPEGRTDSVTSLDGGPFVRAVLAPDLSRVAVEASDGVVVVRSLPSGEVLASMAPPRRPVVGLAFVGRDRVSVMSGDGTVRSCDLSTTESTRGAWETLTPFRVVDGRIEDRSAGR